MTLLKQSELLDYLEPENLPLSIAWERSSMISQRATIRASNAVFAERMKKEAVLSENAQMPQHQL